MPPVNFGERRRFAARHQFDVDGDAELSIADTGVGIPTEDLPHIFDEFRQVERQGGEQTEGTGLGLALVYSIIEDHRGSIRVESPTRDDHGTRFIISLPAASPAPAADGITA